MPLVPTNTPAPQQSQPQLSSSYHPPAPTLASGDAVISAPSYAPNPGGAVFPVNDATLPSTRPHVCHDVCRSPTAHASAMCIAPLKHSIETWRRQEGSPPVRRLPTSLRRMRPRQRQERWRARQCRLDLNPTPVGLLLTQLLLWLLLRPLQLLLLRRPAHASTVEYNTSRAKSSADRAMLSCRPEIVT